MNSENQQDEQSYSETQSTENPGSAPWVRSDVTEGASHIKDKVAAFGRRAVDKLEDSRETTAEVMERTASSMQVGAEQVSRVTHTAAEKLQATAQYVRQTDLKGMTEDVQDIVKRYPGPALAVAAILGFIVARGIAARD